jgi:hypothetical protein
MALCVLAFFVSGCATSLDRYDEPSGTSRFKRIRLAAVQAARDPATWVPAAGALVFRMGNLDQRVSDWAYENTPIFGSPEDAGDASDDLRDLACAGITLTALPIPEPINVADRGLTRAKGFTAGYAARGVNRTMTDILKDATDQARPNGGERSFPSGHTSAAFVCAASAQRNLDAIPMSESDRKALWWTFTALGAGTAWARIESRYHYPSDTLAGAALGNFLANFIYDVFFRPATINDEHTPSSDISVDFSDDATWLRFNWGF